jgi:hypothetical protein
MATFALFLNVPAAGRDSRALHLELFTVPSTVATSCEDVTRCKAGRKGLQRVSPPGRPRTAVVFSGQGTGAPGAALSPGQPKNPRS